MLPFMYADLEEMENLFGSDPWPYGINANRPTLEALVQHLQEQDFISEVVPIEDLFIAIH